MSWMKPNLLAGRRHACGASERLAAAGPETTAVAVRVPFSSTDPAHEIRAREILPKAPPDRAVAPSYDVADASG